MRGLALLAGLLAFPAHADLYRWVDPESGSVKYSSVPPPWYGDAERARNAPVVEVIRGPQAPPAKPAAAPVERLEPAAPARRQGEGKFVLEQKK